MSAEDDVRSVREALNFELEAGAALDRLEARLAEVEKQRDAAARHGDNAVRGRIQEQHRAEAAEARLAEVEKERAEAERLRLIEHRKDFDCIEAAEARVKMLEEALREIAERKVQRLQGVPITAQHIARVALRATEEKRA